MTAVIWTRSASDWDRDKILFNGKSYEVVPLPAITVTPLIFEIPRREYHGAIITSPKAVAIAWDQPALQTLLSQLNAIHTFGDETAKALRERQLPAIQYPVKDGEALAETLSRLGPRPRPYLVIGARESAYDIKGHLEKKGWQIDSLHIYETIPAPPLGDAERSAIAARVPAVICFASPSAVRGLQVVLGEELFKSMGPQCIAAAIGDTTAKACRGHFKKVVTAQQATAKDLVAAAEKALRSL